MTKAVKSLDVKLDVCGLTRELDMVMETFEDVDTNGNLWAPVIFVVHIKAFVGSQETRK